MRQIVSFSAVILLLFACKKDESVNLATPVALAASDVTDVQFVANWQAVDDANAYELLVASSADFSTDVELISNLAPSQTGVAPVDQNTEYFYKVRASVNGEHTTAWSNVISVFTLPTAPFANDPTVVTSSSFVANWTGPDGVDQYKLFVSTEDPPELGGELLDDYDGVLVNGNSIEIDGLEFNTVYYYQLKAVSDDRESVFSNSKSALTL